MTQGKVAIGFCHPDSVDAFFMHSLLMTIADDWNSDRNIRSRVIGVRSGPMVDKARNDLVKGFLAHPNEPEWLLMVDCDMVWQPEEWKKLFNSASKTDRPIVGGLCFAENQGVIRPTILKMLRETNGDGAPHLKMKTIFNYPRDELFQVDGTGCAFLLIHRRVLVAMFERYGDSPAPWFAFTYSGDIPFGEDVTFCLRANQLGFPVYVNTGVHIGHRKTHAIGETHFDQYLATVPAEDLEVYKVGRAQ